MQQDKISILSTRPIDESLINEAKQMNIEIDVVSFIETEPVQTIEVQQEIEHVLGLDTCVVFTSMNAVEAVAESMHGEQPYWSIYCIGSTTKKLVDKYFGESSVAGTASSAADLAELILEDASTDEVVFFCGDQRRDELPDILRNNDIDVTEITVYQTRTISHKIQKEYAGILFFSPSAVDSFFSANKNNIGNQTILFAIGNTTAITLKKYSNNKILVSDEPGKNFLVSRMIEYFS